MNIEERVKQICKDNIHLLDEVEVRQIIDAWERDVSVLKYRLKQIKKLVDECNEKL